MSRTKFPRNVRLKEAPPGTPRRQRRIRIARLLALGFFLTAGLHGSQPFADRERLLPSAAVVDHVIDGDTAVLKGGLTLRYLGLNAPELRFREGRRWVLRPQIFADEAKAANRRLVEGKPVLLEYDATPRDRFGRVLAYVRVGEVFVNRELISQGLAFADVRAPNGRYREAFLKAQQEAREAGRGLWKETPAPVPAQEALRYIGKITWVEGTVVRIRSGKTRISLCFGSDCCKDFAAIIYWDSLVHFSFPQGKLESWLEGRKARVFGPVRKECGPAIIVNAPSQLEVRSSP